MRALLFDLVAQVAGHLISGIIKVGQALFAIQNYIWKFLIWLFSGITRAVLYSIDKEKYKYTMQLVDQAVMVHELTLLNKANQVKSDALQSGWTDTHSIVIGEIRERLHIECGWALKRVDTYMKEVVESVPGLQYLVEGNSESAEDDD
jgi:hypothetical protein